MLSTDFTFRLYVMTYVLALKYSFLHGLLVSISLALNNPNSPVDGHELLSYKISSCQCSAVKFLVNYN